jgi:hypothetical protein
MKSGLYRQEYRDDSRLVSESRIPMESKGNGLGLCGCPCSEPVDQQIREEQLLLCRSFAEKERSAVIRTKDSTEYARGKYQIMQQSHQSLEIKSPVSSSLTKFKTLDCDLQSLAGPGCYPPAEHYLYNKNRLPYIDLVALQKVYLD